MPVTVTRTALGLSVLNINDFTSYYCATDFLGGQVTWNRNQIGSPYVDGQVTTHRTRGNVVEKVGVEILAGSTADLKAKTDAIISAFIQDYFVLTATIDGQQWSYACEAADYQQAFTGPRMFARQGQVLFDVPRRPVPLVGVA
jgi:hypothetical protein